jgi:hypothetical protein
MPRLDLADAVAVPTSAGRDEAAFSSALALFEQMDAGAERVRSLQGHFIDLQLSIPRSTPDRPKPPPFDHGDLQSVYVVAAPGRVAAEATRVSCFSRKASRTTREVGFLVGGEGRGWDLPAAGEVQLSAWEAMCRRRSVGASSFVYSGLRQLREQLQFDAGLAQTLSIRDYRPDSSWRDLGEETVGSLRCRHLAWAKVTGEGGDCRHFMTHHYWLAPELGMRWVKWERTNGSPDDPDRRIVTREAAVADRFQRVKGVWMPTAVREASFSHYQGKVHRGSLRLLLATHLELNEEVPDGAFALEDSSPDLRPFFADAVITQADAALRRLQTTLEAGQIPPELQG